MANAGSLESLEPLPAADTLINEIDQMETVNLKPPAAVDGPAAKYGRAFLVCRSSPLTPARRARYAVGDTIIEVPEASAEV